MALRSWADAICEQPIVLNLYNIDALATIEKESQYHSSVKIAWFNYLAKNKVAIANKKGKYDIEVTCITSRGKWYDVSCKGNESKPCVIATNIRAHFYDILSWIFSDL
jgi:UDP-N-acetyl-2-amino-2-deoxyglucuronate dehydrogenase